MNIFLRVKWESPIGSVTDTSANWQNDFWHSANYDNFLPIDRNVRDTLPIFRIGKTSLEGSGIGRKVFYQGILSDENLSLFRCEPDAAF